MHGFEVGWTTPEGFLGLMLVVAMAMSAVVGFIFGAAYMETKHSLEDRDGPDVPQA